MTTRALLHALFFASACGSTAFAASYSLSRTAIAGGGATGMTAPPYRLAGAVGQPAAGQMVGGDYGLWTGFLWPRPTDVTGVTPGEGATIAQVAWRPAQPNPALARTTLTFELPRAADVRVEVFSVDGRRVASPFTGRREAGRHSFTWDLADATGHSLAPGVYLAVLETGSHRLSQRIVLLGR